MSSSASAMRSSRFASSAAFRSRPMASISFVSRASSARDALARAADGGSPSPGGGCAAFNFAVSPAIHVSSSLRRM